ncbi:MAG: extracellular solute-binding protein [Planctomycetota bacterium]
MQPAANRRRLLVVFLPLAIATLLPLITRRTSTSPQVVVYCAHDSIFADAVLKKFHERTGIHVTVRYDEEASKSLGLTQLLLAERDAPRCDVFWNNQTLGTIRLQRAGLLKPCPPEWFARIPERYRDPEGCWCGFAGRFRVWIVNTDHMQADPEVVDQAFAGADLSRCSLAVPLFGTTLTHYTELAAEMGLDKLRRWHQSLRERGIREARGNGAVRDLVAAGACDFGLTDTDDAFAAIDAGKPVQMLPCRLPSGKTVCIPNSVAIIRNSPHPEAAEKLLKFLLSEEVELMLASSAARQMPLGEVPVERLPDRLQPLRGWVSEGGGPGSAAEFDHAVLGWLTELYTTGAR